MLEILVALGIVFAILLIVLFFNPPEAWVKRMFNRTKKPKDDLRL